MDPEAVTTEDIYRAARVSNAFDFVQAFPKGFDTVVGEKGVLLSGEKLQLLHEKPADASHQCQRSGMTWSHEKSICLFIVLVKVVSLIYSLDQMVFNVFKIYKIFRCYNNEVFLTEFKDVFLKKKIITVFCFFVFFLSGGQKQRIAIARALLKVNTGMFFFHSTVLFTFVIFMHHILWRIQWDFVFGITCFTWSGT